MGILELVISTKGCIERILIFPIQRKGAVNILEQHIRSGGSKYKSRGGLEVDEEVDADAEGWVGGWWGGEGWVGSRKGWVCLRNLT